MPSSLMKFSNAFLIFILTILSPFSSALELSCNDVFVGQPPISDRVYKKYLLLKRLESTPKSENQYIFRSEAVAEFALIDKHMALLQAKHASDPAPAPQRAGMFWPASSGRTLFSVMTEHYKAFIQGKEKVRISIYGVFAESFLSLIGREMGIRTFIEPDELHAKFGIVATQSDQEIKESGRFYSMVGLTGSHGELRLPTRSIPNFEDNNDLMAFGISSLAFVDVRMPIDNERDTSPMNNYEHDKTHSYYIEHSWQNQINTYHNGNVDEFKLKMQQRRWRYKTFLREKVGNSELRAMDKTILVQLSEIIWHTIFHQRPAYPSQETSYHYEFAQFTKDHPPALSSALVIAMGTLNDNQNYWDRYFPKEMSISEREAHLKKLFPLLQPILAEFYSGETAFQTP